MGGWWKGGLAFLACGVLVGLPEARLYSEAGWAPALALATLVAAGTTWWAARGRPSLPVPVWEAVGVGIAGAVLTVLSRLPPAPWSGRWSRRRPSPWAEDPGS